MATTVIDVVAGILRDRQGRVLLAQRPPGKPLAGLWEFPGGKIDAGEQPLQALARELREELGIDIGVARPLLRTSHPGGGQRIRLHAWTVVDWSGELQGLEGQALAWHGIHALDTQPMPAADWPIAAALRLPDRYAITPEPGDDLPAFSATLDRLLAQHGLLVQLRCKHLDGATFDTLARHAAASAERHGSALLLNDRPALAARLRVGLHLPSARLRDWANDRGERDDGRELWLPRDGSGRIHAHAAVDPAATSPARQRRHARGWLAASCHDADELRMAAQIGCDFATLAPVAATASHPDSPPLGWPRLRELGADAGLPLYALGGLGPDDLDHARAQGAFGIAGIRAFWPG